jgi:hypothetical protein
MYLVHCRHRGERCLRMVQLMLLGFLLVHLLSIRCWTFWSGWKKERCARIGARAQTCRGLGTSCIAVPRLSLFFVDFPSHGVPFKLTLPPRRALPTLQAGSTMRPSKRHVRFSHSSLLASQIRGPTKLNAKPTPLTASACAGGAPRRLEPCTIANAGGVCKARRWLFPALLWSRVTHKKQTWSLSTRAGVKRIHPGE